MSLFGSPLFGSDPSANDSSGNFFGHDPSANDISGNPFDISGNFFDGSKNLLDETKNLLDGSGSFFHMLWGHKHKDPSGASLIKKTVRSLALMLLVAFLAGIIVLVMFVTSQNLAFLSSPEQIALIPIDINAPPYSAGEVGGGMMHNLLHSYGFPYSLKSGYSLTGFTHWIGNTSAHSWIYARRIIRLILKGIQGIPPWLLLPFGGLLLLLMFIPSGIISFIFSTLASFQSSVGWSILGIIFIAFWVLVGLNVIAQHFGLLWFIFITPILSKEGRAFISSQVHEQKWLLRLMYSVVLICLAPFLLNSLTAIGMIIGVVLFGF